MHSLSDNAERALRMVRESKNLTYDTEGTGLDWKVNHVVGYVIGAPLADDSIRPEDVMYIPVRHGGGGNLPGARPMSSPTEGYVRHPFEDELAKAFAERSFADGRIVGHHMKFDVHFSANSGIMLGRRLACTQNMAAMADEYARQYSLEAVAEREGVTVKKGDAMYRHLASLFGGAAERGQMAHFWRTSGTDEVAMDYATGDGVSTWEAYVKLRDKLIEDEMQVVMDMENDLIWTIFRMERAGIKVDEQRVGDLRQATERRISDLLRQFPLGFNTRSPLAVKAVMEEAGHTNWPLTPKGAPSFTENWLKKNEVGQKIIEIRQSRNLIDSFINPLSERHVYKGRVHATLNQLKNDDKGTISGRFSCSDPNLQQVPKRNKDISIPFRRLFVPDEGYIFWERDFSQAEPRTFAHYSQCKALLEGYNAEPFKDMHTVTAELLGVERDPTAKRMGMGILTGMQYKSLAGHMGCDDSQAMKYMNQFFGAYPEIKDFQAKAQARLRNRGYVYTALKRRCRLESPRFAYRGTSKIIQGTGADIIKYKLLQADRMCEDNGDIVQVAMTVHDSYNGQYQNTPEARALFEAIVRDMEDLQSAPFNFTVPFLMEGTEGSDWAEASFGVEKVKKWMEARQ